MNWHCKFSLLVIALFFCLVHQELSFCWSINDEGLALLRFRERVESDPFGALSNWKDGDGMENPCTWLGVGCLNGNVVSLGLKDLHLCGTLAPELARLVHLKFIILRNNSFTGFIPDEIAKLKKLEILDLGYNNFSQPLPSNLCNNPSLEILLLDNNELFSHISPGTDRLEMVPDVHENNNHAPRFQPLSLPNGRLILRTTEALGNVAGRKLLEVSSVSLPSNFWKKFRPIFRLLDSPEVGVENSAPSSSPSPSPSPSLSPSPTPAITGEPHLAHSSRSSPSPSPLLTPQMNAKSHSETNISSTISMASSQLVLIIFLLLALAIPLTIAYDNVPIKSVEKTAQVVVEGMVYCQSCDNYGSWSLSGAKPIAEAKVSVICKNHMKRVSFYKAFKTDENGYLFAQLDGFKMGYSYLDHPLHSCRVKLVDSPLENCNVFTNVNYGITGARLRFLDKTLRRSNYEAVIYAAGPFAFRPADCPPTPEY